MWWGDLLRVCGELEERRVEVKSWEKERLREETVTKGSGSGEKAV